MEDLLKMILGKKGITVFKEGQTVFDKRDGEKFIVLGYEITESGFCYRLQSTNGKITFRFYNLLTDTGTDIYN